VEIAIAKEFIIHRMAQMKPHQCYAKQKQKLGTHEILNRENQNIQLIDGGEA